MSSVSWGGVVNTVAGAFPAGGVFPPDWLKIHISMKEMYGLYHLLRRICSRHPDVSRRAQMLIDVDSQSVVGAFNQGCAWNHETHALLVKLVEFDVEHCFMSTLKWTPMVENGIEDAILRP